MLTLIEDESAIILHHCPWRPIRAVGSRPRREPTARSRTAWDCSWLARRYIRVHACHVSTPPKNAMIVPAIWKLRSDRAIFLASTRSTSPGTMRYSAHLIVIPQPATVRNNAQLHSHTLCPTTSTRATGNV